MMISKHNTFNVFFVILIHITPILVFLDNKKNLIDPQMGVGDIYIFFISQFFILLIYSIISLCFYQIFRKYNKLDFIDHLIVLSFYSFLLFYFNEIKLKFIYFSSFIKYSDIILALLIFFLVLFFLYWVIALNKKKFYLFLYTFFFINLALFTFNNFQLFLDSLKSTSKSKISTQTENFNFQDIKDNNSNIYIILFDELPSLEYAENFGIINNKQSIISELKKNNFNYISNFSSNYPYSYFSIASLLNFSYLPEKNLKIDILFTMPEMLKSKNPDINLFKILEPLKLKFVHLGNSWAQCYKTEFVNCYFTNYHFIHQARYLYNGSLYNYLISIFHILMKYDKSDSIEIVKNKLDIYPKIKAIHKGYNLIVFTHILSPHLPNMFDKDCNYKFFEAKTNEEIDHEHRDLFKSTVKCILKYMVNDSAKWADNDNDIIIYISDHGSHYELNNPDGYFDARHSAFFSYKMPKRCEKLPAAKSTVNVMRMALNCSHNLNLDYLENYKVPVN
jgi:hypothetical protein